ncbi:MAG: CARDB domain-containing protein [Thermoplasmatota archaeon]
MRRKESMIKSLRLWLAIGVAGLFLVPTGAIAGEKGGDSAASGEPAAPAPVLPPETPEAAANGAYPSQPAASELASWERPGAGLVALDELTERRGLMSLRPPAPPPARGTRQGPNVQLLDLDFVSPPELQMWTWSAGVFARVGQQTQINVTFNNSGDASTGQVTTWVAIKDIFGNELMNQTQFISDLGAGQNETLYWYWTPTYVTYWVLNIHCDCAGDTNVADNDYSFSGLMNGARFGTALWADTGVDALWSGDKGNGRWHVSDSPELDNASQHTGPDCWYHGRDGLIQDSYENSLNISIKTETLDFRSYTRSWMLHFNYLFHGGLPAADAGDVFSQAVSTDNGQTWEDVVELSGRDLAGAVNLRQDWYRWYTDLNGDGQAQGNELGLDLRLELAEQRGSIRNRFVSNAAITDTGLYLDDFVIYGQEIFDNIKLEITNNIEDTKANETETFNVRVSNVGTRAQPRGFNCTMNITKRGEPLHMLYGTPTRQTVPALSPGASHELTFTWKPTEPGDYVVRINVSGMVDYDTSNDVDARWVHVSGESPSVLVVDDDTGWLNAASATHAQSRFYTTPYITGALTTSGIDYSVLYLPEDHDGPSAAFMSGYDVVVWSTGWDNKELTKNGTLTAADQASIRTYLNSGGALWLSSMELINDLGESSSFVKDVLHVGDATTSSEYKQDDPMNEPKDMPVVPSPMSAVPGSLADGMSSIFTGLANLAGTGSNWSVDWSDILVPDQASRGVFYQCSTTQDPVTGPFLALEYAGASYRVVFQSFDLVFWVDTANMADYAKRVIDFLMGGLSMEVSGGPPGAASQQVVNPGEPATYTLLVHNGGLKTRSVLDITVEGAPLPEGWAADADPLVEGGEPTTELAPGEDLEITLTVTPPETALANNQARVYVNVSFVGYRVTLSNMTTTTVAVVLGTSLRADATTANITKHGAVSYQIFLKNVGNMMVTAELTRSGEHFGWLELSYTSVALSAFEERSLMATMSVPEGAYTLAGNYTIMSTITSKVSYLDRTHTSTLNLTTHVTVPAVYWAKLDDIELSPSTGEVDMTAAKPTARVTVRLTAERANTHDNVTVELKAKSFAPVSGPSQGWSGAGWTLPSTRVETTPFMTAAKEATLTIYLPAQAEAGEYSVEVRLIPGSGSISDGDTTSIAIKVVRPDLTLVDGSMTFSPKNPEVGQEVKIKVTVRNTGSAAAKDVRVRFYDSSGNEIGTDEVTGLAATVGSATVEVTWEGVQEGENEITARVDPDNTIIETSEDNNEIVDAVTGLLSDIVIDSAPIFKVGGVQKLKAVRGDVVTIEVVVKNLGTYGLDLSSVPIRLVDQTTGESLTQTIGTLAKKTESTVTFTWTARKAGTHTFVVTADPDAAINEKSENNNEVTGTLKVEEPPQKAGELPLAFIGGALAAVAVVVLLVALLMRRRPPARAPPSGPRRAEAVVEAEEVYAEEAAEQEEGAEGQEQP